MSTIEHGAPDGVAGAAMADGRTRKSRQAREDLLTAAEQCLSEDGFAGLSTRRVAERAGVPLSQIHYHFGSKQGLLLALYEFLNLRLLERQKAMFASDLSLAQQWDLACDYLEEDMASGYVRVMQELTAAGWSNPDIAARVRLGHKGWVDLLTEVAERFVERNGPVNGLEADDLARMVGSMFIGVEVFLLMGGDDPQCHLRPLRAIGDLIAAIESDSKE